jgi:TetR/AcrR family transcriptional repressor of nem operon
VTEPATERGRRTRERIVAAAAALIDRHGVDAVSLDQLRAEIGVSKSQLYHYFADREDLVRAVIAWQSARVVDEAEEALSRVRTLRDLERFFAALVTAHVAGDEILRCPVGTIAAELADRDEGCRVELAAGLTHWEQVLTAAFDRLRDRGQLRRSTDSAALARATLAAFQGGLLLARTLHDATQLRSGLDAALAYVRSFRPAPGRPSAPARR